MAKTKILVITDFQPIETYHTDPEYLELLSGMGSEVEFEFVADPTPKQFADPSAYVLKMETEGPEWITPDPAIMEKLPEADVLLVSLACVTEQMLEAGKKLKFVGAMRSGLENINVEAAKKRNIHVASCPGRLSDPVADMTLALILCETRGILRGNLVGTGGEWHKQDVYMDSSNRPLCMLKVGLVGFGAIGGKLAKRLIACDSTVYAYDPYTPEHVFQAAGVKKVELNTLLQTCDVVVMMARLTKETEKLIGREQFAMMKPTAIFVNTARAGLVDEAALIEALQKKTIRGAALDVYSAEPLPRNSPLLEMRNVTLMPHRAGVTPGMGQLSMRLMLKQLKAFLAQEG